jgi:hypothetical protein
MKDRNLTARKTACPQIRRSTAKAISLVCSLVLIAILLMAVVTQQPRVGRVEVQCDAGVSQTLLKGLSDIE